MDRDLAFDIIARDRTQAAFDGVGRRAANLNNVMDKTSKQVAGVAGNFERIAAAGRRFESTAVMMGNRLGMIGLAAAAIGTPFAMSMKKAIDEIDRFGEEAQKLGIPVEDLTRLNYAAAQSGVDFETFAQNATRLNKAMADNNKNFGLLNVNLRNASGELRPAADVLGDLADRFAMMPDGARKSALAMEIFGKSGAEMLPFLNQGRDGINKLTAEADRLGITVGQEASDAAGTFNDTLDRLKGSAAGLRNALAAGLIPSLQQTAQWLEVGGSLANDYGGYVSDVFDTINKKALEFRRNAGIEGFFERTGFFSDTESGGDAPNRRQTITGTRMGRPGRRVAFDAGLQDRFGSGPLHQLAADLTTQAEQLAREAGKAMNAGIVAEDPWAGLRQVTEDSFGQINDMAVTQLSPIGDLLAGHFSQAFDAIVDGTFDARDALRELAKDMLRMGFNNALMGIMGSIFPATGGFGGMRAEGGAADPFKEYLVGERGPEVLRMGARGGQIIPNAEAFGRRAAPSTGGQIEIKVSVDDEGKLRAYVAKASGAVAGAMIAQNNRKGAPKIIEASARAAGGMYGLGRPATQT